MPELLQASSIAELGDAADEQELAKRIAPVGAALRAQQGLLTSTGALENNLGLAAHRAQHAGLITKTEASTLRGLRRKANAAKHQWGSDNLDRHATRQSSDESSIGADGNSGSNSDPGASDVGCSGGGDAESMVTDSGGGIRGASPGLDGNLGDHKLFHSGGPGGTGAIVEAESSDTCTLGNIGINFEPRDKGTRLELHGGPAPQSRNAEHAKPATADLNKILQENLENVLQRYSSGRQVSPELKEDFLKLLSIIKQQETRV